MMKLLLFLCFAIVHVLGDSPKNVPNNNEDLSGMLSLNNTEQDSKTNSLSKKIMNPVEPVRTSLDANENNTKLEGTLNSIIQSSTTFALPSVDDTLADSVTVPTNMNEDLKEEIPIRAINTSMEFTTTNAAIATPGKWIVNGTDEICIVLQMSVTFNISYINTNHTVSFKTFDMPVDNATTTVNGSCGNVEQNLTLTWSSKNITNNGSMTLHFMKNESGDNYSFHHLEVILPASDFTNASTNKSVILVHNASNYVVGLYNSYRCLKQQTLYLKYNGTNETSGYLTISDLQFQAFKRDNSTVFGLAKDCAFDTPDVVPIAVGCALAGLVIIVLIAYLVGRRRSQSRGYLSM